MALSWIFIIELVILFFPFCVAFVDIKGGLGPITTQLPSRKMIADFMVVILFSSRSSYYSSMSCPNKYRYFSLSSSKIYYQFITFSDGRCGFVTISDHLSSHKIDLIIDRQDEGFCPYHPHFIASPMV